MSLAQLFGLKETWRQQVKRARDDWFRSCQKALEAREKVRAPFWFESLEARILLNAAPVIEATTPEAIIASAEQSPAPLVLLDGDTTALEQPGAGAQVSAPSPGGP